MFLPPQLVLLILPSMQIGEELLMHIRIPILFIIKFESALITNPNSLRKFCDLGVHPQSRISFVVHLEIGNDLFQ
jgi:hypothetical protein